MGAGHIVLEHSGKLAKNINIKFPSPFDQWLKGQEAESAEIVVDELPQPAKQIPSKDNSAWNERRRQLHKWKKRAKTVGIPPLPSRRPTKGQRAEWEDSIVKAEGV